MLNIAPTYILGISAYYHDSAAALLKDGCVLAAAQEERFTRKKHDPSFPANSIRYVLEEAGISLSEVKGVVFYEKPFLKFERLLETYHAVAPNGLISFFSAMPVWIKEKLFMRAMLKKGLEAFLDIDDKMPDLYFPEHHLSHAASSFFPSPFEDSAIITVDGVGEWVCTSIAHGKGSAISSLKEMHFPHSLGLLYSAFTAYCGFKVNSGEYKLMGLAPYGMEGSRQTCDIERKIRDEIVDVRDDGSFYLNMKYFNYLTGLTMFKQSRWEQLFGFPPRTPESDEINQEYMDMALAIQNVTEDIMLKLAATAREITGSKNLCLAGGVALNCVANGKIIESGLFERVWIQPASGDAGGALGAALALWHIGLNNSRRAAPEQDSMQGAYLGPSFGTESIMKTIKRHHAPFMPISNEDELCAEVSDLLSQGNVVGWYQGRMEYGPRALGNRSILGDPRNPDMQKKLNLKIKYREGFRPFAPSVAEEYLQDYFKFTDISPYMLVTGPVADDIRNPLPENYSRLPLFERLYFIRSALPAITHVNYSARVQTISRKTNSRYWKLSETFRQRHGCAVIVNTSFNVRGEPIVCTPEDAYRCFMRTEMDYLVLDNIILRKSEQPEYKDVANWRDEYTLD